MIAEPLKDISARLGLPHATVCKRLVEAGVIHKSHNHAGHFPDQRHVKAGYLRTEYRKHVIWTSCGNVVRQYSVVLVTPAGLSWLQQVLAQERATA